MIVAGDYNLLIQPQFWNDRQCRELLEVSNNSLSEEAGVYLEGKLQLDERLRKTERIQLQPQIRETIQQSLLAIKPVAEKHYGVNFTGLQPFQLLRYRPGDYFRTHQDERRPLSELTRKISLVLFLNSSRCGEELQFEGGDLVFYRTMEQSMAGDGYRVAAEQGLLLAFPSYLLHEVKEVTAGVRFSLVSWFF